MRTGKFFQIPESENDVDRIRRQAVTLGRGTCPAWLDDADLDYYRYVGSTTSAGLSHDDRDLFLAEAEELREAGLVVDPEAGDSEVLRIYVRAASEYDIWSIGIYTGSSPLDLHSLAEANPVLTRDDIGDVPAIFVADPFMIRKEGRWFMFFEILNWRANKGEIGLATSEDGYCWTYEQRVLVEPFHVSYPYVFEHAGEYYMIPETRQSGAVRLYRATAFPTEWSLMTALLKGDHLVDASVFVVDGHWWLFAGDVRRSHADTLRLYGAESLTGPWAEHPASPIVNARPQVARPGGRVCVECERTLRFGQSCQPSYGVDVRAFEIRELTTTTYREVEVGPDPLLGPSGVGWNAHGMHHVDAHRLENGSWLACVDGWARAASSGRPDLETRRKP